jgi:hypothetical protein
MNLILNNFAWAPYPIIMFSLAALLCGGYLYWVLSEFVKYLVRRFK